MAAMMEVKLSPARIISDAEFARGPPIPGQVEHANQAAEAQVDLVLGKLGGVHLAAGRGRVGRGLAHYHYHYHHTVG